MSVFSSVFPVSAYAVDIKGLYEAEVPVYSQKKAERLQAMRNGMLEVLIKTSGISEIPLMPGIPAILDKSSSYVQQFRYRNWPADRPVPQVVSPSGDGEEADSPRPPPKKALWVRFDKQAINQILQDQGLPIWGRSRPSVLVWLAIDDNGERSLLSSEINADIKKLFEYEAQRRGVPVLFPLMDLEDQVNIRVLDVWGDFQEQILNASDRYQTKAVLSGRLFRDEYDGWKAGWTLYEGEDVLTWESAGPNQDFVFGDAVDGVASALSVRYAQVVHDSNKDAMFISVMDVNSLADHARVARYLQSLASVSHANAVSFDVPNVIYRLDIKGSEQGVAKAIELGNVLVAEQMNFLPDGMQEAQGNRIYRLIR